jgi:AcrR family transcriptional regulator
MPTRVKPPGKDPASTEGTSLPHAGVDRPRGRPRNLDARAAILRAACELMDEAGPGGVTMEAVAARAGVGKPTVYRWFANRHAVAMAALMDAPTLHSTRRRASSAVLPELERQLLAVADTLASRHGRNVTAMIAAADPDTEVAKAFRHHFVLARRSEGRTLLQQAMQRGELQAGLDVEVALDQIYGALFFRVLLGHGAVDAAFVRRLLAQAVRGLTA